MSAKLQMMTRTVFGFSNKARLNRSLFDAVRASGSVCETCRDIEKEVEVFPDGAEFTEAASFPGKTVRKLDAHFKFHWKEDYELLNLSGREGST